ncbi:hypothetical protein ABBQ38_008256 [Trebouxia sp. C0009 RCD-2024]
MGAQLKLGVRSTPSHLGRGSLNIRNSSGDKMSPWMVPLSMAIGSVFAKYSFIRHCICVQAVLPAACVW